MFERSGEARESRTNSEIILLDSAFGLSRRIAIMKTLKKILHIKFTIIVLLLLPFVVFTLLTSKTNIIKNIKSFTVLTGSMQPTIPQGSIIYVQKNSTYDRGDIIAFENKAKQTVTHRVVEKIQKKDGVFYKTKGDANNTADQELVAEKEIVGKNIFSIPYVGKITIFLKTPQGFISLIIFPILVFIGFELWNIKKEIEKNIEKKLTEKIKAI